MTRWASCSRSGRSSIVRSSGWPMRTICSSFLSLVSRLVSRRSCSSTSAESICASSMMRTLFWPTAWVCSRKSLSASTYVLTVGVGTSAGADGMWNSSQIVFSSSITVSFGLKM